MLSFLSDRSNCPLNKTPVWISFLIQDSASWSPRIFLFKDVALGDWSLLRGSEEIESIMIDFYLVNFALNAIWPIIREHYRDMGSLYISSNACCLNIDDWRQIKLLSLFEFYASIQIGWLMATRNTEECLTVLFWLQGIICFKLLLSLFEQGDRRFFLVQSFFKLPFVFLLV